MSVGISGGKSKSKSGSPIQDQQTTIANSLLEILQGGGRLPDFQGTGTQFGQPIEGVDILSSLLGRGGEGTSLAGAGQTLSELIETGAPVDTDRVVGDLNELRRGNLQRDTADILEQSSLGGTRFSTQTAALADRGRERSEAEFNATVSPLVFGAEESAANRRAGTLSLLPQLEQLGLQRTGLAVQDQRQQELGFLNQAIAFLSAGIPQQKSGAKNFGVQGGVAG